MDLKNLDYTAKQTAVMNASEEVNRALKTISDIFKNFQEDYLALLEDNENLRSVLKTLPLPSTSKAAEKPLKTATKPTTPFTTAQKVVLHDSPYSPDPAETPGIVETTQFPVKIKPITAKLQKFHQPKKNLISLLFNEKNTENTQPGPSGGLSALQRSQTQSKVLTISKTNVSTRVTSSGKIEKQSKLVLQPMSAKTDINSLKNTTMEIDPKELEVDETMFERPFTMEDVVELSPCRLSPRKRGRLRLKTKETEKPAAVDEAALSDFEIDDLDPSLTQLEASTVKQRSPEKRKSNSGAAQRSQSPVLVENRNFLNIVQPTRADMDETYFPRGEEPLSGSSVEILEEREVNPGKRKCFGDETLPPQNGNLKELEIDCDGEWDTDVSMDKWTSNPPQKKALMDSFDVVPEKKKTSPKFAYKGPVVRNKAERAKLKGWSCKECEKYYENMGLSEEELQKRMNQCSRHRSKFNERYNTPPGFWNPVFDTLNNSSQETIK